MMMAGIGEMAVELAHGWTLDLLRRCSQGAFLMYVEHKGMSSQGLHTGNET